MSQATIIGYFVHINNLSICLRKITLNPILCVILAEKRPKLTYENTQDNDMMACLQTVTELTCDQLKVC